MASSEPVPPPPPAPELIWLAAYTRPRHEVQVKRFWEESGLRVFLPTYHTWRQWSDRRQRLELPLFPSYVFVCMDLVQRQQAVLAPGFLWFVHDQHGPVRVDTQELEAVRTALASGLEYDAVPTSEIGDEVEVVRGSMTGCRGFLLRKQDGCIALCISAINGAMRVTLPDPSWIAPVRKAGGKR
ncbi:MAG: transcription termination/antitermination NusG family protein [Terriglobales bacterium]